MSRKIYPKIIGICLQCKDNIVANYGGMNKPDRKFCSYSCNTTYRNLTDNPMKRPGVREKLMKPHKNHTYKWPEERKIKWAESLRGDKSRFWKGGLTSENRKQRNSPQYKSWRTAIYERDNYTCKFCNIKGGKLNADHIKIWSLYPKLRFDISNGQTLCRPCHKIKTIQDMILYFNSLKQKLDKASLVG